MNWGVSNREQGIRNGKRGLAPKCSTVPVSVDPRTHSEFEQTLGRSYWLDCFWCHSRMARICFLRVRASALASNGGTRELLRAVMPW